MSNTVNTYFIDIDGTIIPFLSDFADSLDPYQVKAKHNAVEVLLELHSRGDTIILVTARPEPFRQKTEECLQSLGIIYDQLIMGVGTGCRILINDQDCSQPLERRKAIGIMVDRKTSFFPSKDYLDSKLTSPFSPADIFSQQEFDK